MKPTIYEYTKKIREIINKPRIQHRFLMNRGLWNQLCSSLDVLEDTDLAIEAYSNKKFGSTNGGKYLALYGLLQAMVTQQDAVFHLCESLNILKRLDDFPKLREIRNIRIESIGHPTKRSKRKKHPTSYHFITRITLKHNSFTLGSEYSNGKSEHKNVSIPNLISEQKKYVVEILESIRKELIRRDTVHKEKFKMKKLVSAFPDTLGYYFEKIYEAIGRKQLFQLGKMHIELLKESLKDFEELLAERGIEISTYDAVRYLYEEIEYPLDELEKFFQNAQSKNKSAINEKTAYIFLNFLKRKIFKLNQIVREIDDEYAG